MEVNLRQTATHMDVSQDDAEIVLHNVIARLGSGRGNGNVGSFSHKTGVTAWEESLARNVLRPLKADLQEAFATAKRQVEEDKLAAAATESAVRAVIDGGGLDQERKGPDMTLVHSSLWRPVKRVEPAALALKVGGESVLKEACPNLARTMLEIGDNVSAALRLLPDVLRLHRELAKRYGGRLDVTCVAGKTIEAFVETDLELREGVQSFVKACNLMWARLFEDDVLGKDIRRFCQEKNLQGNK